MRCSNELAYDLISNWQNPVHSHPYDLICPSKATFNVPWSLNNRDWSTADMETENEGLFLQARSDEPAAFLPFEFLAGVDPQRCVGSRGDDREPRLDLSADMESSSRDLAVVERAKLGARDGAWCARPFGILWDLGYVGVRERPHILRRSTHFLDLLDHF